MTARPIHLNFAARPRALSARSLAVLALGVAALALAGLEWARMASQQAALEAALDESRAKPVGSAAAGSNPAPNATEQARARWASQTRQRLGTPWAELLESLESVQRKSVAVLAIEPSVSKGSVRITAETRQPRDMLAYVAALQERPNLGAVVLVSHQVQAKAPGTPIRFEVVAAWGVSP